MVNLREREGGEKKGLSRLTGTVKGDGISFPQTHRVAKLHGDPQWRNNWNMQFLSVRRAHCRHAVRATELWMQCVSV